MVMKESFPQARNSNDEKVNKMLKDMAGLSKNKSQIKEYNNTIDNATSPVLMVKKIRDESPNAQIALTFFNFCIVAATCKTKEYMMNYKAIMLSRNKSSAAVETCLLNEFTQSGKLNLNQLGLIGNLLMCCVPSSNFDLLMEFRKKLNAGNIFVADIGNSDLTRMQKKIIKITPKKCNKMNARICGTIMNNLMMRCINNLAFPNISFLTDESTDLTQKQVNLLKAGL